MPDPGVSTQAILVLKADFQDLLSKLNRIEKEYGDVKKKGVESFSKTGAKALELNATLELLKKGAMAVKRVWDATVGEIVTTAADFEILQTRLTALYRDVDIAAEKFQKLKTAAKETPFRLKNIVEAQAQLKAFGFVGDKTIKMAADLAAFMGEDIVFAANSMGRAFAGGAGAADILRERGVLTLIKLKAGINDLKSLTLPEFRKALIETMQDPMFSIAGAAEKLMRTYRGGFSNLQDSMDIFKNNLGAKILPALTQLMKLAETSVRNVAAIFAVSTTQRIKDQQLELNSYVRTLLDTNVSEAERTIILSKLNPLLNKYLGYTIDSAVESDKLREILNDLNGQFERSILIEIANQSLSKYTDITKAALENLIDLRLEQQTYTSEIILGGISYEKASERWIKATNERKDVMTSLTLERGKGVIANQKVIKFLEDRRDAYNLEIRAMNKIIALKVKETDSTSKIEAANVTYQESLIELAKAQAIVNKELEEGGGLYNRMAENTSKNAKLTDEELKKVQSSLMKQYKARIDAEEEYQKFVSLGKEEELDQLIKLRSEREGYDLQTKAGKDAYLASLLAEYRLLVLIGMAEDKNIENLNRTVDIAKSLSDAIWDSVSGAESLGEAVVEMFKKIANQILQDMILYLIGLLITGGGTGMAGIIGSMGGITKGIGSSLGLPGFAKGGSFTVGGAGGTDNNVVAFNATKGERVDITPAGMAKSGGSNMTETNELLRTLIQKVELSPTISQKQISQAIYTVLKGYTRGRS